MKKTIIAMLAMALLPLAMMGQAKKPTLMVVPADTWCAANGYMTDFNDQGKTNHIPDYEEAIQTNMDLYNVVTKIGELMAEQGFPMKDLSQTVKSLRQSAAEDEMTTSRTGGSALAETPLDRLLNRAKADILVEVAWQVNTTGPKQSITYTLRGLDAYTNTQVAAAQGTGKPSFSAELPVLLEEAVIEKMDGFTSQLQAHFDDLMENGREVNIDVRIFDNGSGLSFEEEYDGDELTDVIDNWMAENTVNHRYNLADATDMVLHFEKVRIPLYRTNGRPMDTRQFVTELRKYLSVAPYSITSKVITKGLGKANLILGEK
ncbi:MAG: hypothetical protein IJ064_06335 [Bacteroidaceae bacterium]|nr:hypothetical protein [Bacteroidaceae bacterium]